MPFKSSEIPQFASSYHQNPAAAPPEQLIFLATFWLCIPNPVGKIKAGIHDPQVAAPAVLPDIIRRVAALRAELRPENLRVLSARLFAASGLNMRSRNEDAGK